MISTAEKRFGYALTAATIISITLLLLTGYASKLLFEAPNYSGLTKIPIEGTVQDYELKDRNAPPTGEEGEISFSFSTSGKQQDLGPDRYYFNLVVGYHPAGTSAMAVGKAPTFDNFATKEEALAKAEDLYPLDSTVKVYYNPERFEHISLRPPPDDNASDPFKLFLTALQVAFLGLVLIFIFGRFWWSRWSRDRAISDGWITGCSCSLLLLPIFLFFALITILSWLTGSWFMLVILGGKCAGMLVFIGWTVKGVLGAPKEKPTGKQPTQF